MKQTEPKPCMLSALARLSMTADVRRICEVSAVFRRQTTALRRRGAAVKLLTLPGVAVCLAVVLSITAGCERDTDDHLPDPTGSGVLTGRWAGSLTTDAGTQWESTGEDRWSVSHEGSSVTITFWLPHSSISAGENVSSPATYDQDSRILTWGEWKYRLSADNNTLVVASDLPYQGTHSGSMVRQ
jgi:hypothetical protein